VTKFILLLICTLLVIPVIYLIPLRLSSKDKLLLIGLSFVLTFGGLFTLNFLSYWTSVGSIVCLAFISAYIVEKRMSFLQADDKEIKAREDFIKSEMIYQKAVRAEQAATGGEAVKEPEILEEISMQPLDLEFQDKTKSEEDFFLIKDVEGLEELINSEEEFAFLEKGREIQSNFETPTLEVVEFVEEPLVDRSMLFDEIEEMKNEKG
jgi:membrane protein implicated in regulation of membrane protease activity